MDRITEEQLDFVKFTVHIGFLKTKVVCAIHSGASVKIYTPGLRNAYVYMKSLGYRMADVITSDYINNIDIMLGCDFFSLVTNGIVAVEDLTFLRANSGLIFSGIIPPHFITVNLPSLRINCHKLLVSVPDIKEMWKLESIGIYEPPVTLDEKYTLDNFDETVVRNEKGQYIVRLPFKTSERPPTNYNLAYAQILSQIRKFKTDPIIHKTYEKILADYISKGFIEKVDPKLDTDQNWHVMPHHHVKKDSISTPIRIVFNASSKTQNELSLNDTLYPGPSLTTKLMDTVVNFRTRKYAITADISKAFLRILLESSDRNYTRFLFCHDLVAYPVQLTTYRFCVVPFGVTSSPFLLAKTLEYHFSRHPHPLAKDLESRFYVDNYIMTTNNENDLYQIKTDLTEILEDAGMPLQAWCSNSLKFNESQGDPDIKENLKLLGLVWDFENDTISLNPITIAKKSKTTRRIILSTLASVYDILGIFNPIIITGKLLVQKTWVDKVGWDTDLNETYKAEYQYFCTQIQHISEISFRRSVGNCQTTNLHIFVDASEKAYGACAYLVSENQSTLLISKSRLAPLTQRGVNELELTALLVGCRLAKYVNTFELGIANTIVWSDSLCSQGWVTSGRCTKLYIRNRVSEIKKLNYEIRFVRTRENPSDLLTRGVSMRQLKQSVWFAGPSWLKTNDFPEVPTHLVINIITAEPQPNQVITSNPNFAKYSVVQTYINKIKTLQTFFNKVFETNKFCVDPLICLIKLDQQTTLKDTYQTLKGNHVPNSDIKTQIKQLGLQLDSNDLIRSYGRLQKSNLTPSAIHPILLPAKSHLTALIVSRIHSDLGHTGVNTVLSVLRDRFWVSQGRSIVKTIISRCVFCRKVAAKPLQRSTAPSLPEDRVQHIRPFNATGIDYANYLVFLDPEKLTEIKSYLVVFTCLTTRAVHLELTTSLSTQHFLLAFRKFVATKSLPSKIYTDNASYFVKGEQVLNKILEEYTVKDYLESNNIRWSFIVPRAPWQGGHYERLIGVVKRTLKRITYKKKLSFDECTTVIKEAEAIVNNRPLCYVSSDPDQTVLTPNHLLYGRHINLSPMLSDITDVPYGDDIDLILQYKILSDLVRNFERIWKAEYLVSLRERYYDANPPRDYCALQVDDAVLLNNEKPSRESWPLGRIIRVNKDKDGILRSIVIKTQNGQFLRTPDKVVPLELNPRRESPIPSIEPLPEPVFNSNLVEMSRERPKRKAALRAERGRRKLIENAML